MQKRFLGLGPMGVEFRVEIVIGSVRCKFICICHSTPAFPMIILPDGNYALHAGAVYLKGEWRRGGESVVLTPDQVDELVEWVGQNAAKWRSA